MFEEIIKRTLRVPAPVGDPGDGSAVARQLDGGLMSVGFKLSPDLFECISGLDPQIAVENAVSIFAAARELVGDHVEHNPYFIDFPVNVPDTKEFWLECIVDALFDPDAASGVTLQLASGAVNLLDLPKYGRYQHTYEEMVARQGEFIPDDGDRVTVLELGGTLAEEASRLYLQLAASEVPLSESDLELVSRLAVLNVDGPQPETIPVRETRAEINRARLEAGLPVMVDTTIDVLRLACALSDGDVSLVTATRFRSFRRAERHALLAALEAVVAEAAWKLRDVGSYREQFKRLGERLHPHEYADRYPHAVAVFETARGEISSQTLMGAFEALIAEGELEAAVHQLAVAPGLLLRTVDRLCRLGVGTGQLASAVADAAPKVSTRVLLSLREHLMNRGRPEAARVFVNQQGRAWVTDDQREPLPSDLISVLLETLDAELASRLPRRARLVVDPAARTLAVPLSGKGKAEGIGVVPRGSVTRVDKDLRFFVYWKESTFRTDFDLGVLLLDENFEEVDQISWTNLKTGGAVHSGDVTESSGGATEFVDVDLSTIDASYIVPQVAIYSGEGFDEVEEGFFGYMERDRVQKGEPFEPRTVRMKSDLTGTGRTALPVIFARDEDGGWYAKWMHLVLSGRPSFNQIATNSLSTSLLARSIMERDYLQLSYLEKLMTRTATSVTELPRLPRGKSPVVALALEKPSGLPEDSAIFTPTNLSELLSST